VIAPPHLTLSLDLGAPTRLAPFLPAGQTLDLEGLANGVRDHVGGPLVRAIEASQPVQLESLLASASRAMDGRVLFSTPGRIDFDCEEELLVPAAERIAQVILARCVRTEHLGDVGELQLAGHIADRPNAGDVGLHFFIDFDETAALADFDSCRLETQPFAVRREGSCDQHLVHFESLFR